MELQGSNDSQKLLSLCSHCYKDQAIWFLNAFWDAFASQAAEAVWEYAEKFAALDLDKRAAGSSLDELNAHRFLEQNRETLTVLTLREALRKTGAIAATDRPKEVPLTHYLLFKFGVDWHVLVNSKGDNSEEIAKAQRLLDEVSELFEAAERAEAPFKKAQEEVDAALAEVKAQEEEIRRKTEELKRKSTEGGVVQQNKAKNELAQLLAEDPLPLRRAKITLEAALKRAEKARAPFEAATEAARAKVEEAEAYLEEVASRPGSPHGRIWWMERELHEKKKYMPTARGGIAK